MVDKFTKPDCIEEIKTNTSVLTNEIGKYICGKNKLLVVGYINVSERKHAAKKKILTCVL